jgi:hypothetical protein
MNENLAALLPPIGVLILFVLVIRTIVSADRRERAARAKIDAEIARKRESSNEDRTEL